MIGFASLLSPKFLKGLIVVAVVVAVGGAIYGAYIYVEGLNEEIATLIVDNTTLAANVVTLEGAIETQQQTIASLQRDIELQAGIFRETNEQFEAARNQVDSLRERLGRHELGALARAKPGLVENVINNATDAVGRCFEIASGAPLTEAELNATLPSQINRECPDLANPNFRDE